MKKLNLIYALFLLSVFTSCQKDHPIKSDTPGNKPPVIANVRDSVSYTVEGKTYITDSDPYSFLSAGGEEMDRKVVYPDSSNKFNYALVGNPDSVLYYQKNTILSNNANLGIFFIKKYSKKHKNDGVIYHPELKDLPQLFAVGKHPYAEDFGWKNSQDGIALNISVNGSVYISYAPFNPNKPSIPKPGFQKNSTFEIISFTKATSGGYNLEARFVATVTDNVTGEQKKLENGYLRLYFVPIVAADPN